MPGPRRPPPSLSGSARDAWSSLVEDLGAFLAGNAAWVLVALAAAGARASYPPAAIVGLALVPATAGLTAMATAAARGRPVALRTYRRGITWRLRAQLSLGAAQLLLLVSAALNVAVGLGRGGLLGAAAAIFSGYVFVAVWLVAIAAWPLLLDPDRADLRVRTVLRLAGAVVVSRPLPLLGIALVTGLLAAVAVRTLLPMLVVPALGSLLAAHYVLPAVDRISPAPGPDSGRGTGPA